MLHQRETSAAMTDPKSWGVRYKAPSDIQPLKEQLDHMKHLIPLIALSLIALTACEKETKQVKDDPITSPDATTDATPKADKAAACQPVTLTKLDVACFPGAYADNKNPESAKLIRTQAELDALYAARDLANLSEECKSAAPPTIDFTKQSILLIDAISGGCSVKADTAACLGAEGLEVKATVHSHGTCEKLAYIHDAYTLPVVAADVAIKPTFTHEQHKD